MLHQLVPQLAPLPRVTRRSRPTGLTEGTMVMTSEGAIPVEFLLSGDKILTRNGLIELRGTSVLQALEMDVVVIDPEAACQTDPLADTMVLPASQQVLVRDWRAMILHGQEEMLTPVSSLVDDITIRRETRKSLRLFRLHFDAPQVIKAGGLELASARSRAPLPTARTFLH
ncbi:Hint domain-containing protein [Pararhodobacter sp. CCB-MM2]|uniref:Hint domain-containing protein n=1 Tax=Pararhodobacter sp. CCB-MM2 TaxID=1786003 RepID=UPI00082B0C8D|nr:Hint domain-containing protein [Pararhodobacter sp. CCB-MM2]